MKVSIFKNLKNAGPILFGKNRSYKMSDIREKLIDMVLENLEIDNIKITDEALFINDPCDSFDTVELIMMLEEEFDIEIKDSEAKSNDL